MSKKLKIKVEFSSVFKDYKWLNNITIFGFVSTKGSKNAQIVTKIIHLINKYNEEKKI